MRRFRRFLLFAWLLASAFGALAAQTPEPAANNDGGFARGNALYAEGKFAEAAGAYEAQARRGEYSADLFYNLANAYYRAGERGRAILNYQRALLLDRRHAEAAANLAFVRGRVAAPPVALLGGGLVGWLHTFAGALGVDAWTWLAAAAGWVALGAGTWAVLTRRGRLAAAVLAGAGALVCAVAVGAVVLSDGGSKNPARAIVLADDTRALYSPADNSKSILTLSAGGEVQVLSEQGAWVYVRLADGSLGWVSADRIERVIPAAARGAS